MEKMATDPDYWYKIFKESCNVKLSTFSVAPGPSVQLEIDEIKKVKEGTIGLDQYLYRSGELHRNYLNKMKEFYNPWMCSHQIIHLHARATECVPTRLFTFMQGLA